MSDDTKQSSGGGSKLNKVFYGGIASMLGMAAIVKTNVVSNVTQTATDLAFRRLAPYMNQYHRAQGISLKIRYGMLKKFGSGGRDRPIKLISRDINDRLFDKTDAHEATLFRQEYYDMKKEHYDMKKKDINIMDDFTVQNNNNNNNYNENNNTISIVNIGNKKKGKSFNSSILSLFLTNRPILFESNHDGRNLTTGIDISPKLELDRYHSLRINERSFNMRDNHRHDPGHPNRYDNEKKYKYVSIMDMEGNDPKLNETDSVKLQDLVFNDKHPCVIVHACAQFIDDNDVDLALNMFKLIDKNNIPYIITCHSTHPEYKIENDENYLTLTKQNNNIFFCQLPHINKYNNNNPITLLSNTKDNLQMYELIKIITFVLKDKQNTHALNPDNIFKKFQKFVEPDSQFTKESFDA